MIHILSGNLNTLGNAGNFETDRSTWGFPDDVVASFVYNEITRSPLYQTKALYSAKCVIKSDSTRYYAKAKFTAVSGKKYFIKANIYTTPALTPNPNPGAENDFYLEYNSGHLQFISEVKQHVSDFTSAWKTLELYVSGKSIAGIEEINIRGGGFDGDLWTNSAIFIDEFEVYEYEDVAEPVCTLLIDVAGTVITNSSLADGSIDIATTGGVGSFEYSIDNGATWQPVSLFTGLAAGIYPSKVREIATPTCVSSYTFSVPSTTYTFNFSVIATNETIVGANDGTISITVTGTLAPFTFSKDAGGSYQGGNVFTGLAPGVYTIVVKDDNGVLKALNVTINPGGVIFDKVWFSKNPVTFPLVASPGWDSLVNFKIYDNIKVEDIADTSIFNSKLEVALPPATDGSVEFQVRQAFRGVLKANAPSLNDTNILRLTDRIKLFKHYTGEMNGTEAVPVSTFSSLPHLVLLGGLNKFTWPTLDYFVSYLQNTKKFMTWAPVKKIVDRYQEDYLNYWVFNPETTTLRLTIKAYFDDNTDETSVISTKLVKYGDLYQIPSGSANSGALLINPAKNLINYDLWLTDQDDEIVSETRFYKLTTIKHPLTRYFMFLNSLGAFEVLRFTGGADKKSVITKDQIVSFLPSNYNPLDGELKTNNSTITRTNNFSSGFITESNAKEWFDYLNDFLMSNIVFDVTDGRRKPISVQDGTVQNEIDQNYERFIRFTGIDSYTDESYTPDTI